MRWRKSHKVEMSKTCIQPVVQAVNRLAHRVHSTHRFDLSLLLHACSRHFAKCQGHAQLLCSSAAIAEVAIDLGAEVARSSRDKAASADMALGAMTASSNRRSGDQTAAAPVLGAEVAHSSRGRIASAEMALGVMAAIAEVAIKPRQSRSGDGW